MSEWIPIGDRLPEVGADVLITVEHPQRGCGVGGVAIWREHGEWCWPGEGFGVERDGWRVVAWMPMPAPYIADTQKEKA